MSTTRHLLLAALGLAANACAADPALTNSYLDGWIDDRYTAVRAIVATHADGSTSTCSGSLISKQYVLTSARCVKDAVSVSYGSTAVYDVARHVKIYPGWDGGDAGNVALIVPDAEFSAGFYPLPLTQAVPTVGELATFVGVGQPTPSQPASGAARSATTAIDAVSATTLSTTTAAGESAVACLGDQGGPLILTRGGHRAIGGIISNMTAGCDTTAVSRLTIDVVAWILYATNDPNDPLTVLTGNEPALPAEITDGATISLSFDAMGCFLSAPRPDGTGNALATCDRTENAPHLVLFDLNQSDRSPNKNVNQGELLSGDKVYLQQPDSYRYVSADQGGQLNANRSWPNTWETFTVFKVTSPSDGNVGKEIRSGDRVELNTYIDLDTVYVDGGQVRHGNYKEWNYDFDKIDATIELR